MRAKWAICVSAGLLMLVSAPASASLVYGGLVDIGGAGFGDIPRMLTIQQPGANGTESGCVGITSGGSIAVGSCTGADALHDGNGVVDLGGNEVNPFDDNQKYGIPTASSLGITSADQIQVVFNATEPGQVSANEINLTDLTLKFYSGNTLIGSIDGQQNFAEIFNGNGNAGFYFVVSPDEWAYVNGLLAQGNIRFALEATATGTSDGPDSFFLQSSGAPVANPVPEPGSLMLLGAGLLGLGRKLRRA